MLFRRKDTFKQLGMDGGAIIGQGTYGCVFDPPLLCAEAKQKRRQHSAKIVGKLTQAEDAENELDAAIALHSIPDSELYFVLPNPKTVCKPKDLTKQPGQKDLKHCEAIERFGSQGMVHFTMPYGGITIKPYYTDTKKSLPEFDFIKRLLEAGSVLTLHGYCHYDIHLGNILMDAKTGLPRLIDFGMSFSAEQLNMSEIDSRRKLYSAEFYAEPPEVTVGTGLYEKMPYETVVKEVAMKKEPLIQAEKLFHISRISQLRDFNQFWTKSASITENDPVKFFKLYWPAFDAWGIGSVLISLYRNIILSLKGESDTVKKFADVKKVIKGLLRMNPRRRLDCLEALDILDPQNPILQSASGKGWLKERAKIRVTIEGAT